MPRTSASTPSGCATISCTARPPADPILIAAKGPRMLQLTARHADAWNTAWFGAPDDRLRQGLADLERAMDDEGRDPQTLRRTVGLEVDDPDFTEPEQEGIA